MTIEEDLWPKDNIKVLHMGAGVQTTAILLMFGKRYDHTVFADTGDEHPGTYEYIEKYLKPYCKEIGLPFHTVKNAKYDSLMEKCLDRKIIPIRQRRWCTEDFKIVPIQRFIRSLGARKHNKVYSHIGISIDESHRLNRNAFVDKPQYYHKVYPLVELKITRAQCKETILEHGWPLPVKSGCDFCPFSPKRRVMEIAASDPERYRKIVEMERIAMKGRPTTRPLIGSHPLPLSHSLGEYMDEEPDDGMTCDTGYCMEDGI